MTESWQLFTMINPFSNPISNTIEIIGITLTLASTRVVMIFFICFESHEQFFSYLATVTIAGDRAANLDICLALTAFSSEGSFTCHTYCDMGPLFLRSYPKDPWFYLLNAVLLAKKQSLPILNVLGLTRPARAGLELTTYRLLSENTTTRLRQPVSSDEVPKKRKHSWSHPSWILYLDEITEVIGCENQCLMNNLSTEIVHDPLTCCNCKSDGEQWGSRSE
jgi:hypothetical protein